MDGRGQDQVLEELRRLDREGWLKPGPHLLRQRGWGARVVA